MERTLPCKVRPHYSVSLIKHKGEVLLCFYCQCPVMQGYRCLTKLILAVRPMPQSLRNLQN